MTLIVFPGDPELDDPFGDLDDGEGSAVVGVLGQEGFLWGFEVEVEVKVRGGGSVKGGRFAGFRSGLKGWTYEGGSDLVQGLLEFGLGSEVGHGVVRVVGR